ncbi:MAG: efflux RND transporter periplasmic adaptor subunit [Deltaproteobacteria bacterium]|nr:efflux RND transporter periplasmic adaptor subunit [Deltaproteobacteria bacterium]
MESRKLLVAALCLAAAACQRASAEPAPAAAGRVEERLAEESGGPVVEEPSDLDRPVEELRAEMCEHGIPTYKCAECRYEVGMVPAPAVPSGAAGGESLVATAKVETRALSAALDVLGEVVVADDRTVHVSSRTSGVIHGTPVRLGHDVFAGDVLVEIDSPELADAKTAFLLRQAERSAASRSLARERSLVREGVSAGRDRSEAQAAYNVADLLLLEARTRLRMLGLPEPEIDGLDDDAIGADAGHIAVAAPLPGTVTWVDAALGETVEVGRHLFIISDLSTVWVWVDVVGEDIARVLEQPAGIRLRGTLRCRNLPGAAFPVELDTHDAVVDETTRTLRLRGTVSNPERRLRPGMFVDVRIELSAPRSVPVVPEEAVLWDEGREFVFVLLPDRTFVRRPVTVGRGIDGWTEIVAGLEPGAEVATRGAFLLKSDVLRAKMGAGCAD